MAWFDDPVTIDSDTARYPPGFSTPGAVRNIQFAAGEASHVQNIHQVAFYAQDDWRLTPRLTLNLGLRWDANIGNLPDQTDQPHAGHPLRSSTIRWPSPSRATARPWPGPRRAGRSSSPGWASPGT